ncbi:NAD(+)/NADH kinase [Archaeoglobales archaeon]|nr:MAG: NAD(+)/NADH kinase [Archaeoglobales archaeon]
MRVAVVSKDVSSKVAREVENFLVKAGIDARLTEINSKLEDYDLIISVGGDGTILSILQKIKCCPPIFGINTGRIGLLTHAEVINFKEELNKILRGFEVEEFMRVECLIDGESKLIALNEIAILSSIPAKLIELRVFLDDIEIEYMRCDGMLFSTPMGSTAYALATGGPIIDPYLNSILIIPVAPFKLAWKPWVVNPERKINVELHRDAIVVADGQNSVRVGVSNKIEIIKSKYPAVFVKHPSRIQKIAEKLCDIR